MWHQWASKGSLERFVVDWFLVDINHLLVAVFEATDTACNRQQTVGLSIDRQCLARLQAFLAERLLNDLNDLMLGRFDERVVVLEVREHNPHSSAAPNTRDTISFNVSK